MLKWSRWQWIGETIVLHNKKDVSDFQTPSAMKNGKWTRNMSIQTTQLRSKSN